MALMSIRQLILMYLFYDTTFALELRKWTLHAVPRNWNDAYSICQSTGDQLATPVTDMAADVFVTFMGRAPWQGNIGLSALAKFARNRVTQTPEWFDCTDPLTVWGKTNNYMDEECGTVVKEKKTVATVNCFGEPRAFVCEHIESPYCPYTKVSDKIPDTSSDFDSQKSIEDCRAMCDSLDDCMAYVYSHHSGYCDIYQTSDALYFENGNHLIPTGTSDSTTETFYRTCFLAELNSGDTAVSVTPRLDAMDFTCGHDPRDNSTVFTMFEIPVTWDEAVASCVSMGQTIAILNDPDPVNVLSVLEGDVNQNYHWVGFKEKVPGTYPAKWLDGVDQYSYLMEEPVQEELACGAALIGSKQLKLHSCSLKMPYICQQVKGKCGYAIKDDYEGVGWTDHGTTTADECKAICDGLNDCVAFDYRPSGYNHQKTCHTETQLRWQLAFHSSFGDGLIPDTRRYLGRWTCIWLEKRDSEVQKTSDDGANTQTTTATTSTEIAYSSSSTQTTASLTSSMSTLPDTSHSTSTVTMETDSLSPSSSASETMTSSIHVVSSTQTISPTEVITSTVPIPTSSAWFNETTSTTEPTSTSDSTTSGGDAGGVILNSTANALGLCTCTCARNMTIPSSVSTFVHLKVDLTTTQKYKRSKESAKDFRPSAQGLGAVACVFISVVFFVIILSDAVTFWNYINTCTPRSIFQSE